MAKRPSRALEFFHPAVRDWFTTSFKGPTSPQSLGWPAIARGESTLILSPTGSGKTLAAFLWAVDRLMFSPLPAGRGRCRILYVSPLKALAVDVERNLRAPLAGIADIAARRGDTFVVPAVAIRTGDTPAVERARFLREPADILITTPESLYLLLTSRSREALRSIQTVIVDEIHALVPTKRGAHLALSLERLETIVARPLQRIGLSATQRPLDEVARFLGGATDGRRTEVLRHRDHTAPAVTFGASDRDHTAPAVTFGASDRDHTAPAVTFGASDRDHTAPAVTFGASDRDHTAPAITRGTGVLRRAQEGGDPVAAVGQDFSPAQEAAGEIHAEFNVGGRTIAYRPVTIVDAHEPKRLRLTVEIPVEDLARLAKPLARPGGPAAQGAVAPSIWSSIHPRLLNLVRAHRTTLIFVNSRRLAERLASALNDLAGEPIVRSHHGSLARPQRVEIEDDLKAGRIPALVATSSLELGIDMGAVDLVIQIEAPPSVASGMQRIGRASHQVDAVSEGVIFPKFRGDLVACAAITRAMHEGRIEATRYPRNPLDVLAQQIVATVAIDEWRVDDLFATCRSAAPYAALSRRVFEGVLDMLSGRYPSDEFAELRPRVTWDRIGGTLRARQGAQRVAIVNGGTIPDRGLYGVFLAGAAKGAARVGELDEEMVFESRVGETFMLGSSSWRIEEITHDRVLVSPAPGEPGKMPFWHGDRPGRPLELGLAIGRLIRELRGMPRPAAVARLTKLHDLDKTAAENLLQYLADQEAAVNAVPDDRTLVIERCRDELGDWRVSVLAPLGGQVLIPWVMAAEARIAEEKGLVVETMWSDDGFVVRFPDTDEPPDPALLLPPADDVERLLLEHLGSTALFAAHFREIAARALLLPRRRPGTRTPLWQQRKRAADLLAVAARYGSFPALLETYRECLRDVFDVPALVETLTRIGNRTLRVVTVDSEKPSPFAASVLFSYTANFLYDGDAPLAERRAQALLVDQAQLRELVGEVELRELLDPVILDEVECRLQHLDPIRHARSLDGLHDLLLRIGDLTREEIRDRSAVDEADGWIDDLVRTRRAIVVPVAGEPRMVAVEDASRYRDALGVPLPAGIPETLLEATRDPVGDLALRYARTHGPFTADAFAARYALARDAAERTLASVASTGRIVQGEFRPGRRGREWCEADVLRQVRQRSLARLRREVEPVDAAALGRFAAAWQGVAVRRKGLDALLDVVEQLQGVPLAASEIEREILPARLDAYQPSDLDFLIGAGEVLWVGLEAVGERDGRIALYLTDHLPRLLPPLPAKPRLHERALRVVEHLRREGASFFPAIHDACGAGYPGETVTALWDLAWLGLVTNDTFHALRSVVQPPRRRHRHEAAPTFRSRRTTPPAVEGRWSLVESRLPVRPSPTERATALAWQLLSRHGLLTREAMAIEGVTGGFAAVYDVLKALEDAGRVRRGYFVAGLGAAQFALPAAVDLLRSLREEPETPQTVRLAATDPANPYGAILRWPTSAPALAGTSGHGADGRDGRTDGGGDRRGPTRSAGAVVILVNGMVGAYVGRSDRQFQVFLPDDEASRAIVASEVARALHAMATEGRDRAGMLIADIDDVPADRHPLAPYLVRAGFHQRPTGFQAAPPREGQD